MLTRFMLIIVLLYSSISWASPPTEEDLNRWVKNWESLVKPGAYDFVPRELSFELMFSEEFQKKVSEAEKATNPHVDGMLIELVGFMIPIEIDRDKVHSFLLVPEAGQCIHVPPPPVNQTVFVNATAAPVQHLGIYEPVIISGRLTIESRNYSLDASNFNEDMDAETSLRLSQDSFATSGYSMQLERFELLSYE